VTNNRQIRFCLPPILLLAALLVLTACANPAYYWQAVRGHFRLMHERQDVSGLLADPATDPALRQRLLLARQMLDFAERDLDLPAGDSYQELVQAGGPVTWNVVATPRLSLEPRQWCFPVAGCVAYRGYFERARAEDYAHKLRSRGMDVAIFPASAYSTLGWFDDPLLDTMLDQPPARLAGTLFHELAHQKLYVRGDTRFNEAYASFVEGAGVERWLNHEPGHAVELEEWRRREDAGRAFSELIGETRRELAALYESGYEERVALQAKQAAFDHLRLRYDQLVEEAWGGDRYFSGWMGEDLNNAHLVAIGAYAGGRCAFAGLMRQAGGQFSQFQRLAAQQAQLDKAARSHWLDQPCPVVASDPEL